MRSVEYDVASIDFTYVFGYKERSKKFIELVNLMAEKGWLYKSVVDKKITDQQGYGEHIGAYLFVRFSEEYKIYNKELITYVNEIS